MSQTPIKLDPESPPSTPRWVKVGGILVLILVLLLVILHLTGNSFFGPGGHTMPMQHSGQQP